MTAMLAVENILAGRRAYDVGNVNQDAEYQEVEAAVSGGVGMPEFVPQPASAPARKAT
jgi:hypothetical protein